MAGLKKYDYTNENGYSTTLLLTAEDAKKRGLTESKPSTQKQAPAPQNKQAGASNK